MKHLIKGYVAVWVCLVLVSTCLAHMPEELWDKVIPYFNLSQYLGIGLYLAGGFIFNWTDRSKVWCDRLSLFLCLCGGAAFITASSILYVPLLI